jgi:hypothetical protein
MVAFLVPWPASAVVGVIVVSSFLQVHPTTVHRGRKVKNLDFTTEGDRATLTS